MRLAELATFTDDVEGMTAFYRVLLEAEPVAASADMAIFLSGDTRIFIHRAYIPQPGDLPPENHIAFAVPDVDAVCARLAAAGFVVEAPPAAYDWGRSAYLRDPSGRLIELSQSS
jgi:catechol 2,3-dioxygenase-like lactoylglutathione lyase family enzyme